MCGIIGYTGSSQALPILIQGIRLLSYRGYDSAGVAIHQGETIAIAKDKGRIADLAPRWDPKALAGTTGIGHTRWATHGGVNRKNAHPHTDVPTHVAVVHNGIIENDLALREALEADGVTFASDTDTEIVAHLFAKHFEGDLVAAAAVVMKACHGTFALAIQHVSDPTALVAVRRGSPLLIGLGVRENLVASDLRALAGRADSVVDMGEDQIALVRPDGVELFHMDGSPAELRTRELGEQERDVDKGGHAHYMLKEIHEQPERLYELIAGRLDHPKGDVRLDEVPLDDKAWNSLERIDLIGCGTSFHACMFGAYLLEAFTGIPSRAMMAHEYDVRRPHLSERVLVVAVSQSGETADTKVAMQVATDGGARTLGVLNVRDSMIGRNADGVIDMHAGPEVGVASTKAYTGMLAALSLLAIRAGRARNRNAAEIDAFADALRTVPDLIRQVIDRADPIHDVVREIYRAGNMLYLGRGVDAATALEGALKMKEISYIHAEGYPAGEMKHGPIALVSFEVPTVAIATSGPWRERMLGNVREVRARDGLVILVACEGDRDAGKVADFVLRVPEVHPWLAPLINVIPLQILAYETAKRRGCDIDQPRNLAKTVTVQ